MSLRDFLSAHADKLALTVLISVMVAGIVGFRRRSTAMANFISCVASATLAIVLYPLSQSHGYSWEVSVAVIGVGAGGCAYAAFGVLMKLADLIEEQGGGIASRILDRFLPPSLPKKRDGDR